MYNLNLFASIIFYLLISISFTFAQDKQPPPPPGEFPQFQGISVNSQAPNFQFQSINDKNIELNNYLGKYVLIDFWGTWCEPCRKETSYLKKAYKKYGNKIQFIGIAVNDNAETVMDYVKKNNIKWPQIFVPFDSMNTAKIIEQYNVHVYPSLFLVSPSGTIQFGAQTQDEIDKLRGDKLIKTLDNLLK